MEYSFRRIRGRSCNRAWRGRNRHFQYQLNNNDIGANFGAALSIGGFVFNNTGTTNFYASPDANRLITIGTGGITVNSGAGVISFENTANANRITFALSANQTWANNSSNTLIFANRNLINLNANTLTVDGTGAIQTDTGAVISGAGGNIVKNGSGILTLSAANTFTGGIVLNTGTLRLGNNAALGTGALTINGGAIDVTAGRSTTNNNAQNWNGDFTFGGTNTWDTGTGAVTMNASRTVTVIDSIMTVGGNISGGGFGLTKEGAGTLRLNGTANTYSGGTTVNAGALSIGTTGALPSFSTNGSWSVASGATLAVQNAVSDADIATMLGTTNFQAGSLLGFDTVAADRIYNAVITDTAQGALGVTKIGANSLRLGGNNTFSGGIKVVNNGVISATHNNAWGTGAVTITGTGFFEGSGTNVTLANDVIFNNTAAANSNALSSSTTFSGNVSGTGDWSFNGFTNGTLGLSGNNTGWSGNLSNVGGSQLRLGHVNALGTGVLTIGDDITSNNLASLSSSVDLSGGNGVTNNVVINSAGAVFYLDNNLKLSGVVSGPGSVRVGTNTTATLFLTGNNTYTGFTNIQAGTVSVTNLGNGGESRNIGATSNAATNLIIGGSTTPGTLAYTGTGESTDRLFTIGSAQSDYDTRNSSGGAGVVTLNATVTGKIDSSGTGALVFSNTGELLVGNALNNILELTGSNTGNNTLAAVIGNTQAHAAIALANSTTNNGTNGSPNRQITVTDTTGIRVGDIVTGTTFTGNVTSSTVTAVLGPTRIAVNVGTTVTSNTTTLTFTQPDVSLNKTSVTKSGAGTWILSGANTYTGSTLVAVGTLVINGSIATSSGVQVDSGAVLAGSGRVSAISGAGRINPGNSSGILTATTADLGGGLGFSFELTSTGNPTWNNATASGNDVLHLTNTSDPFAATSVTASNVFDIYLGVASITNGDAFNGGFFAGTADFAGTVANGTYNYYVFGNGAGTHGYNGTNYYTLAEYNAFVSASWSITHGTLAVTGADFATGTVNGYVQQFSVVPEPTAWILAAFGLTTAVVFRRRRQD